MLIQVLISGLVVGCVYGLIALGYSLIYKASGLMTFAQGDILTLGAFMGYTFYGVLKIPFFISLILVVIIVFLLGLMIEKVIIRRLLSKHTMAIYIVLATIAVSYIIQNGSTVIWGTKMLYFPRIFKTIKTINILNTPIQTEAAFSIGVAIICMLGLHFFMKYTRFGTAMRASAMDAMAAKACGINPSLATGITWGIAAGIAALAGMLIGPIYGVFITLGATIGRKGFASAVMGGYGNMYGAMLGGIILGLVETMTATYISSSYKDLVAYGLLLAFLYVRPTGILNERAIAD